MEPTFNIAGTPLAEAQKTKERLASTGYSNPDSQELQAAMTDQSYTPTVLSSENGKKAIETYKTEQANDTVNLSTTDKNKQANQQKMIEAAKNQGGLTAEEIGSLGGNVADYSYVKNAGLYLPKNTQTKDPIQTERDEIDDAFAKQEQFADLSTQNLMNSIRATYDSLMDEQRQSNRDSQQSLRNYGLRSGASRYSGESFGRLMDENTRAGIQALSKLAGEQSSKLVEAQNALIEKKYTLFAKKREEISAIKKARTEQLTKIAEAAQKRADAIAKEKADTKESVIEIALDAKKNGAPTEIVEAAINSGSVSGAVTAVGDYLESGSGIVGEYLFYKRQAQERGQIPQSFEAYQDADANRKQLASSVMGVSGYTPAQEKVINSVNDKVSKNDTYKKTTSMKTYADNVNVALSQKSGVGDIAAINQFQKVIDEGAVTRDQDVKLISSAQSLSDSLKTKLKKLQTGETLSENQRKEIKKTVDDLYASQVEAMKKDPYIKTQTKNLERNGIKLEDTIVGELNAISTTETLLQSEDDAKAKIIDIGTNNPDIRETILNLSTEVDPTLGRPLTYAEIYEWVEANNYTE